MRFKEGTEERNFFLEQNRTIFIFSAYTDACTSSFKIVVASKTLRFQYAPTVTYHLYILKIPEYFELYLSLSEAFLQGFSKNLANA